MGRSPCCDKDDLKKGPWTAEEDTKLVQYIQKHGTGNWRMLPKNAGLQRCGKSCRLRWTNYLRPDIKRGRFSFDEEETIIQLHSVLGNKWSAIAARLPGRTDNEIKNYWNTHIRRRLMRMGIDPVTHARRLDYFDLSSLLGSSQMGLSTLFGLQTLLNPQALRLALSLLPPPLSENHDNLGQKLQEENQLIDPNVQSQTPSLQASNFDNMMINSQIPISNDSTYSAGQIFQENLPPAVANTTTTCDQCMDNNYCHLPCLNFDSILPTPLSSQSSPSALINGIMEEDNSFCSDLLRFEIPEGLDFDDFM